MIEQFKSSKLLSVFIQVLIFERVSINLLKVKYLKRLKDFFPTKVHVAHVMTKGLRKNTELLIKDIHAVREKKLPFRIIMGYILNVYKHFQGWFRLNY